MNFVGKENNELEYILVSCYAQYHHILSSVICPDRFQADCEKKWIYVG